jgi:hypothetical protein
MDFKIAIQQDIVLDDVEALQTLLGSNESFLASEITLSFTPYKSKRYFGLSVAIIQLVATWLRHPKSGNFVLNTNLLDDESIKDIYKKDEAFFSVISIIFKFKRILNKNKTQELNDFLRKYQNEYFLDMMSVNNTHHDSAVLVNYDNHFSHPAFENHGRFISTPFDLSNRLRAPLVKNVLKNSFKAQTDFLREQNALFGIIYELMKNTFEWGKTNENGISFNPSVRGLIFKFFKKERQNFIEDYIDTPFVAEYFQNPALKENSSNQLYFIEISVFDTGAGLVRKYKSSNNFYPEISDIEIIKLCLIKHNTSSSSIEKTVKGIGLDRILETTNKKGFIRIRTDKYSLYRNMIKDVYVESKNAKDIKLYDWEKQSSEDFTTLNEVSGTVISIIYPINI